MRGLPTARTGRRPPAAGLAKYAAAHQEVQRQHVTQISPDSVTAIAPTPAFLPREGKAAAATLSAQRNRRERVEGASSTTPGRHQSDVGAPARQPSRPEGGGGVKVTAAARAQPPDGNFAP